MDCISTRLPYRQSGAFAGIVLDYIDQSSKLSSFFSYPPTLQGIQKAIESRKKFDTKRKILVDILKAQYSSIETNPAVQKNIDALLSEDCFTITTAHQCNLFTGPLYFIYKIVHIIKLASHLNSSITGKKFVPVYCMGSEDADFDELGHIYVDGQKLEWKTEQTGAVGRMKVDKSLLKLVDSLEGQLSIHPFGKNILELIRKCYKENVLIQDATFHFVNELFGEYGLIVLIPDSSELKCQMIPVFEDDLLNQSASGIVEQTIDKLQKAGYKTQANPREVNLFFLDHQSRERIIKSKDKFKIHQSKLAADEIIKKLKQSPEKFSPNVILRGLYQETILPNIIYVGGGGEIAYWLQLKELFEHYKVPYPVLALRNSFLVIERKWQEKISKLGFSAEDIFLPEQELVNKLVEQNSKTDVKLNGTFSTTEKFYDTIKKQATAIDNSLAQHVDALKAKTLHRLYELEKKMLRAEKKKYVDGQRQIHSVKEKLFPSNGLQERYDNILSYYSKWGYKFIKTLLDNSLSLEQEFVILTEK